jgi:hypothetical protein
MSRRKARGSAPGPRWGLRPQTHIVLIKVRRLPPPYRLIVLKQKPKAKNIDIMSASNFLSCDAPASVCTSIYFPGHLKGRKEVFLF